MLVESVYPKLREYCSQRYGVDFQVSLKNCIAESGLNRYIKSIGICTVKSGLKKVYVQ